MAVSRSEMSVLAVPLRGGRGDAVGVAIGPGGREMGVVGVGGDVLGAQMKVEEVVSGRESVVVFIEACLRSRSQSLVDVDLSCCKWRPVGR